MGVSGTDFESHIFSPSLSPAASRPGTTGIPAGSGTGIPDGSGTGTTLGWSILIPMIAGACVLVLAAVIVSVIRRRRRRVVYEEETATDEELNTEIRSATEPLPLETTGDGPWFENPDACGPGDYDLFVSQCAAAASDASDLGEGAMERARIVPVGED
jgi:hypothetical protein